MPAIQSLQTAIGAHPNHDAIATARLICRPPGAKFAQLCNYGKGQAFLELNVFHDPDTERTEKFELNNWQAAPASLQTSGHRNRHAKYILPRYCFYHIINSNEG